MSRSGPTIAILAGLLAGTAWGSTARPAEPPERTALATSPTDVGASPPPVAATGPLLLRHLQLDESLLAAADAAAQPPLIRAETATAGTADPILQPAARQAATAERTHPTPAIRSAAGPADHASATLRAGAIQARLGAQKLAYNSLIHQDLNHHGAVAAWGLGARTRLKGFMVEPSPPTARPGLATGPRPHDYQLHGWLVQHELPLHDRDTLKLTGGWVSGRRHLASEVHADRLLAGSAWSLGGTATLLAERLRLSFEYAGSRRDADGPAEREHAEPGALAADLRGQAYKAAAELHSAQGSGPSWRVGTEYSWVDAQFSSVANPTLGADRLRLRSFGSVMLDDWLLDVSLHQVRSNLDAAPDSPTQASEKIQATVNWTPSGPGISGLIGKASFKLIANLGRKQQIGTLSATAIEQSAKLRLESEFRNRAGIWGINAAAGQAPGAIDAAKPTGVATTQIELHGNFRAGRIEGVKPLLSWQLRGDRATGTTEQRWRIGLGTDAIRLQDELRASFDVGFQQRLKSDNADRQVALTLGGKFAWTLQRPRAGRNGLALTLSGGYLGGEPELVTGATGDGYRLMLSLSTSNPLADW